MTTKDNPTSMRNPRRNAHKRRSRTLRYKEAIKSIYNIVGPTFLENLTPDQLDTAVGDTERRYGVGLDFLTDLVKLPNYGDLLRSQQVGKDAIRYFRLVLEKRNSVLTKLAPTFPQIELKDNPLDDPFYGVYYQEIGRIGGQKVLDDYLRGNWNEEIERTVKLAQRNVVMPQSQKTKIQQKPRVSFRTREDWLSEK